MYEDVEPLTNAPPDADAREQVTALFEAHALGLVKLAKVMLGDPASKMVFKAPSNCSSLLLTPDGGTVVCATLINYPPADSIQPHPGSPGTCGTDGPRFVAYSAATGKRLRVLYQFAGPCSYGVFTVLWSDTAARHVIGESWTSQQGNMFDRYGVAAEGNFTKFQVAKHGQWYAGPAF